MSTAQKNSHAFMPASTADPHLLRPWVLLCLALALHITEEATTGFLSVYNSTVTALRHSLPWIFLPVFEFHAWLTGLIVANAILLFLSPLVVRGLHWIRPIAYAFALIMFANGIGHILGTVFDRTVASVRFPRPMPGFYSSPLLLVSSVYLFIQLRRHSPKLQS